MKDESAKLLVDAAFVLQKDINAFLGSLQFTAEEEEVLIWKKRLGKFLGEMYFDVMIPLYQEHPKYYQELLTRSEGNKGDQSGESSPRPFPKESDPSPTSTTSSGV